MSAHSLGAEQLAAGFQTPSIEYGKLSPMLIVLGVAVVGVLVEAFMGRALAARDASWCSPSAGSSRRSSRSSLLAGDLRGRRRGRRRRRRPGAVPAGHHPAARDARRCSPIGGALARHRRPVRPAGSSLPGSRARAGAHRHRGHPDRGLPADHVRGRRHAALPGRQRPAHDVRRPRGALAAAVPAVRAGPPASPAQPGGRRSSTSCSGRSPRRSSCTASRCSTATPARCGCRGIADGRQLATPASTTLLLDRHRAGRRRAAVQGRRRAVPLVDAGRLPGRADPGHRRSWPPAPRSRRSAPCCGCSTSALGGHGLGLAAR